MIGGLFFGHGATGRFSAYHERLITGMAAHAAIGVDNARLFAAARAEIAARERAEALYRSAELRLSAVLDNTNSAILVMNDRQECVYMNAPAERLTGFTLSEVQGRTLHDVIHHTHPDGTPYPLEDCPIDRAFPDRARQTGEEVFVRPDGTFYPVAFIASPVKAPDANVLGTVIEVRDLTEEKRRARAMELLMREVDHRARNNLTIVQSLIRMSSAQDLAGFKHTLSGRVDALARAQTSLAERKWEGGSLTKVIAEELSALCPRDVVTTAGPEIEIPADKVQPLSMILHELATNANKYGACSRDEGRIHLSWEVVEGRLDLEWVESGGPEVSEPKTKGFGSRLIQGLAGQMGGTLTKSWRRDGMAARLVMPLTSDASAPA